MTTFDTTWATIRSLAGTGFTTKTGKPFTYSVSGNTVMLHNTNRGLPRSNFERAASRAPLNGPGQLQDLQGPSYLYAILTDSRVAASSGSAPPAASALPAPVAAPVAVRPAASDRPAEASDLPGTPVSSDELKALGFIPHELRFITTASESDSCEWDTLGDVPDPRGCMPSASRVPRMTIPDHVCGTHHPPVDGHQGQAA